MYYLHMTMQGERYERWWSWLEVFWGYTGTLAALVVLTGVLGRGIMQTLGEQTGAPHVLCYAGLFNSAAPEPPRGLGLLGQGMVHGVPHVRLEQHEPGRPHRAVFVDAMGLPQALPGSQVAEQRVRYDARGHVLQRSNFDAAGQPVADVSGVAVREFRYDKEGRLVHSICRGVDGKPVVPRLMSAAQRRTSYDAQGRPLVEHYLDEFGKPTMNYQGEETVTYQYDDVRQTVTRSNTVQGNPMENRHGYAKELVSTHDEGREKRKIWLDSVNKPVLNTSVGAVGRVQQSRPNARVERNLLLVPAAAVTHMPVEHLVRYTANGQLEWECYNAENGLPRNHPVHGYAERVCEYNPDGTCCYEYFWDDDGRPAACYEKRYVEGANGQRYCLSLFADSSSSISPVEHTKS